MSRIARASLILVVLFVTASKVAGQTEVVLAVDLSGTMTTNDPSGYRFVGANQFMTLFAIYGKNRAGVVAFGDSARVEVPLDYASFDKASAAESHLRTLSSEQWTELGMGLERCLNLFISSGVRAVVMISDGKIEGNPRVRGTDAATAQRDAERELWDRIAPAIKRAGIRVYTIGLMKVDASGEGTLSRLAKETGGFYVRVDEPSQFSDVYKRMLDDIDAPSAVVRLTPSSNSVTITRADDGLFVRGKSSFSIQGPRDVDYRREGVSKQSPIRSKWFTYDDGTRFAYLTPSDISKDLDYWKGVWSVELPPGQTAEATYISSVKLRPTVPIRNEYFMNELIPVRLDPNAIVRAGGNIGDYLKNCIGAYTSAPVEPMPTNAAHQGKLGSNGTVLEGEFLANQPGNFDLVVTMTCDSRPYTVLRRYAVAAIPLLELDIQCAETTWFGSPTGQFRGCPDAHVGDSFKIVAKYHDKVFTDRPWLRGAVADAVAFQVRYNNDVMRTAGNAVSLTKDPFESEDLIFQKVGDLTVQADLKGGLIVQKGATTNEFAPLVMRARAGDSLTGIRRSWLRLIWQLIPYAISMIVALTSVAGAVNSWRWHVLARNTLTGRINGGVVSIDLSESRPKTTTVLRTRATVKFGAPDSGADVPIPGSDGILAKIWVAMNGDPYITAEKDETVYVSGQVLKAGEKVRLHPDAKLQVGTAQLTWDDSGES